MRFPLALLVLLAGLVPGGRAAHAAAFSLSPGTQVVGEIRHVKTRGDESLREIAARFDVSASALARLNAGVDPSRPGPGAWITLPTQFVLPDAPREGLVINVAERRAYCYVRSILGRGAEVLTFPVVLGERDWAGMLGPTRIEAKLGEVAFPLPVKHGSEGVEPGRMRAPALRLGIRGCLIEPVAPEQADERPMKRICIGLAPGDLERLYEEVGTETPVRILDQPHKAGWRDGALYLESHASFRGDRARSLTPAVRAIVQATAARRLPIDWEAVRRAAEEASGVPVRVSR